MAEFLELVEHFRVADVHWIPFHFKLSLAYEASLLLVYTAMRQSTYGKK